MATYTCGKGIGYEGCYDCWSTESCKGKTGNRTGMYIQPPTTWTAAHMLHTHLRT